MAPKPGDSASPPAMWLEGDILVLRVVGQFNVSQMQMLIDMGETLFAQYGYVLVLGDSAHTTGMDPDARKLHAQRLKHLIRPNHTAIYHVSTTLRVLTTLAQRGIELFTGKVYEVTFHKDEAEARAELTRHRAILRRNKPPTP